MNPLNLGDCDGNRVGATSGDVDAPQGCAATFASPRAGNAARIRVIGQTRTTHRAVPAWIRGVSDNGGFSPPVRRSDVPCVRTVGSPHLVVAHLDERTGARSVPGDCRRPHGSGGRGAAAGCRAGAGGIVARTPRAVCRVPPAAEASVANGDLDVAGLWHRLVAQPANGLTALLRRRCGRPGGGGSCGVGPCREPEVGSDT
ncbi:unannotated protein [freshwater metagenome]|uniref:Unannotated protein n=1 Tax=freshwater metagenome TaxID=449393 RepID=A0A6J7C353_9ZZZZ